MDRLALESPKRELEVAPARVEVHKTKDGKS